MKFVREYCTICGKEQSMQVVQEDETKDSLIWVRCPCCQEIKPLEAGKSARPGRAKKLVQEGSSLANPVRYYRAGETYEPGEWIYHPRWQDTGQVVEKSCSGGGKQIIVVKFNKVGTKRLVTNYVC